MPKPSPGPKPNQLRVWLKQVLASGALERIPPEYPHGRGGSCGTIEHALSLQAELRDPDTSPRTLEAIAADAAQFQRWVEARRQASRRIILAGSRQDDDSGADDTTPPEPADRGRPRKEPATWSSVAPRSDPMWDEFLDGLGS